MIFKRRYNISFNIHKLRKLRLFYIIKKCEPSGCMTELTIQIVIILVGKQLLNNAQEIILP